MELGNENILLNSYLHRKLKDEKLEEEFAEGKGSIVHPQCRKEECCSQEASRASPRRQVYDCQGRAQILEGCDRKGEDRGGEDVGPVAGKNER